MIAYSIETVIAQNERSFIIDTSAQSKKDLDRFGIGYVPVREKGANDSRSTWLELRKFRSIAAAPSRKSKYRLRTWKSIPARNIYRQRVTA